MTEQEAIKEFEERLAIADYRDNIPKYYEAMELVVKDMEEVHKYRAIGTVEEIEQKLAELSRWNTTEINPKIKNVFANTSTLICQNCDHKDEYIEELEAELQSHHEIGTPEECRAAVEEQKDIIRKAIDGFAKWLENKKYLMKEIHEHDFCYTHYNELKANCVTTEYLAEQVKAGDSD